MRGALLDSREHTGLRAIWGVYLILKKAIQRPRTDSAHPSAILMNWNIHLPFSRTESQTRCSLLTLKTLRNIQ